MSGSGGGGGGGFDNTDCSSLQLRTTLSSPKSAVLKTLKKNDQLIVELQKRSGKPIVVARTDKGQEAGSITSSGLAKLIECLQQNHPFKAVVVSVDGGGCVVDVLSAK